MLRNFSISALIALGLASFVVPATVEAGPYVRLNFGNGTSIRIGDRGPKYPPVAYRPVVPVVTRYQPVQVPVVTPPVPGYVNGTRPIPAAVAHDQHYHVMYRRCDLDPWREYASYNCHELAHDVEVQLIRQGYQAKVVHHD